MGQKERQKERKESCEENSISEEEEEHCEEDDEEKEEHCEDEDEEKEEEEHCEIIRRNCTSPAGYKCRHRVGEEENARQVGETEEDTRQSSRWSVNQSSRNCFLCS